jgi:hypothetical protein
MLDSIDVAQEWLNRINISPDEDTNNN